MGRDLTVPSKLTLKAMNAVHRLALRFSGGRLGWTAQGMPVIELTTIGRKSGEPRSTMLTSPVQEGGTWVVVGSRGGDDNDPAWVLNARENPHVEAVIQGKPKVAMNAREASQDERDRLWPLVTSKYPHYAAYQARTERQIPLVLLEPV